MAEVIGIASGILALLQVSCKSSVLLYEFLNSLEGTPEAIRALRNESKSIADVLGSLSQTISEDDREFDALRLPIFHCGEACKRFRESLEKLSGEKTRAARWKDWLKMQFMGKSISEFKDMLSGYRATISIAVGDANLRQVKATATVVVEYQQFIKDTVVDLKYQYEVTQEKLELIARAPTSSSRTATEQDMLGSLAGARQCIEVCLQVSDQIERAQSRFQHPATRAVAISSGSQGLADVSITTMAELLTVDVFKRCRSDITKVASEIEEKITRQQEASIDRAQHQKISDSDGANAESLQAELESVADQLHYLDQASLRTDSYRTNHYEDISVGDDSHQAIVSTIGDLISARRITFGSGSTSWMGQMSDETLQQLSRDRYSVNRKTSTSSSPAAGSGTSFGGRHGAGQPLGGKN